MRGLFLQQPLELRLEVSGDTFNQGAAVPCRMVIKNHGSVLVILDALALNLALGALKKVKAKQDGAFEVTKQGELEHATELAPHAELSFSHTFTLDINSPISDKAQSPYLLYGNSAQIALLGQLPLTVTVHPHIRTIFETMGTVFNFVNRGETSKNGWTSVKLKPPESRRLSFVDELNLSCRFHGEALEVRYIFTVKKFATSMVKVEIRMDKTEVLQRWEPAEYLFGAGYVQQTFIERLIEAALAEVSSGL